jgi:mycofactocin precursor
MAVRERRLLKRQRAAPRPTTRPAPRPQAPAATAAAPAARAEPPQAAIVEELLIEEVSIDGMCGVY